MATSLLVAGCSLAPALNPLATPWGDRVPEPAPDAVAAQPVVTTGPGTVTILPISPVGATVGNNYGYTLGHCGVDSPIDVDGSFWDPVVEPSGSAFFNATSGLFRLATHSDAVFTASDGELLALTRHVGAKEFPLCA